MNGNLKKKLWLGTVGVCGDSSANTDQHLKGTEYGTCKEPKEKEKGEKLMGMTEVLCVGRSH